MSPKLSVIIPIYKVENYLERCVNSVLRQDYRNIEVILVDDGSPDRCPQICDEFARKDDRVIVIHKKNGGLSSARNAGINVSAGKYITFLDSDDQWREGMLSEIMDDVIESSVDMFTFGSLSLYPDGTLMTRNYGNIGCGNYHLYNRIELYQYLLDIGDLREQAATHIMKSCFVKSYNLLFQDGIISEDIEWMFRVLRVIDKVAVSNKGFLIYTEQRPGSITNSVSSKSVKDLLGIIQSSVDFYNQNPEIDVRQYELANCAYLWSIVLAYSTFLPYKTREKFIPDIKNLSKCLPLDLHPKSKLAAKLYKFLGYHITSGILGIYLNLHNRNILNRKKKFNG